MELRSDAFASGQTIPTRYTCDGENVSPALTFSDIPSGATSLALICEDPDAPRGTFTHWVLFNIPPQHDRLAEGQPGSSQLSWGGVQGRNDFGGSGYGGPCPPRGPAHRYFFRLFALNDSPQLSPGATRAEVLRQIEGRTIATAELVGLYSRK